MVPGTSVGKSPPRGNAEWALAGIALISSAVAVGLGVLARIHEPSGGALALFGFPSLTDLKLWLGSVAAGLGLVQLVTALWMYRRVPGPGPRVARPLHRISGLAAVVVSLPVAVQCLWVFGFGTMSPRVLAHSVAGCLLYGAFVGKMLALRSRTLPTWVVPCFGGLVLTSLLIAWGTSVLWWLLQ